MERFVHPRVTLRSLNEENAVEHAAGFAPGVRELINELKVDSKS